MSKRYDPALLSVALLVAWAAIAIFYYAEIGIARTIGIALILAAAPHLVAAARPGARDAAYRIGLYSLLVAVGAALAGVDPKLAAAAWLILVAGLLAYASLRG